MHPRNETKRKDDKQQHKKKIINTNASIEMPWKCWVKCRTNFFSFGTGCHRNMEWLYAPWKCLNENENERMMMMMITFYQSSELFCIRFGKTRSSGKLFYHIAHRYLSHFPFMRTRKRRRKWMKEEQKKNTKPRLSLCWSF